MDITVGQIKALLERLQRGGAATTEREGAATGAAITDRERSAAQRLLPRDPMAGATLTEREGAATGAALGAGDEFQEFLGGLGAAPDGALVPGDNQVPILRAPEGPNKRPPTEDELMADRRREMIRAMRGMDWSKTGIMQQPPISGMDWSKTGIMQQPPISGFDWSKTGIMQQPPSRNKIGAKRRPR